MKILEKFHSFINYFGGWRSSYVLAAMLLILSVVWVLEGRDETGIPLFGALGWYFLGRAERRNEEYERLLEKHNANR